MSADPGARANPSASDGPARPDSNSWSIYRRLLRYAKPYTGVFLIGLLGMVLFSATQGGLVYLIKTFLRDAFVTKNPEVVWTVPIGVVVLFVFRGIGDYMSNYYPTWVGRQVIKGLRRDVFAHYLRLPTAYLDRLHCYIPGWEVDTIRGEMFSEGYGFVVDYIAEVLKSMRNADYSDQYQEHFTLGSDISTRDRDGIHKTFSGLMKILFPHGDATKEEIEEILRFAVEGRKRVKDQILRIDSTMAAVKFGYLDKSGEWHAVSTLEEDEYPAYYHQPTGEADEGEEPGASSETSASEAAPIEGARRPGPLFEGHREFQENQRGVSYDTLLLPYLRGATKITITDPYIRQFHQARNLMELAEALAVGKDPADEVKILVTTQLVLGL